MMRVRFTDTRWRPAEFLIGTTIVLIVLDAGQERFLTTITAFSALQLFANFGLVALGLGLTMLIGEFDLSVAGMFSFAACIAVLTGATSPALGVILAVLAGLAGGIAQGVIMTRLRLSSVGVTLGGLLVFNGLAYVITQSRSVPYAEVDVAVTMNNHIAGIFSVRSLVALALYVVAGLIIGATRIGRDLTAIGSDRRAALIAGVNVSRLVIGTFAVSGALAAMSGALLGYSLAAATPSGLSDILVPAAAAAIIGGVSLGGGTGRPLGIAIGVLTLAVLRSGLNALGLSPFVTDIMTGGILLSVAILDAPGFARFVRRAGFAYRNRTAEPRTAKTGGA
jgi:ribose/xylose/arabinose/galactoside ABC-type transport system permease subunit